MNLDRLRAMFIDEARTRMTTLTEGLLALEQGDADEGVLDTLMRQTHSLKGSAGLVGMPEVATAAHEMEGVIESIAEGRTSPAAEVVDGSLADRIEQLLADGGTEPEPLAAPAVAVQRTPPAAPAPPAVPGPAEHRTPPAAQAPAEHRAPPDAPMPAEDATVTRLPVDLERLDAIVRLTGEVRTGLVRLRSRLAELSVADDDLPLLRELELTARRLQRETTAARTVPLSSISARLQRAVRDAARTRGVQAVWVLQGGEIDLDRKVLDRIDDALLHIVRNSVAHGIEPPEERRLAGKPTTGEIVLRAEPRGNRIRLTISDDGRGLDREALRASARTRDGAADAEDVSVDGVDGEEDWTALVFRHGVSTAADVDELAGRGLGMDVVAAAVRDVRGSVHVDSDPGRGTTIVLQVPLTLAVSRCLEVLADGGHYALPVFAVATVLSGAVDVDLTEDGPIVRHDGRSLPLLDLSAVLGGIPVHRGPVVVLDTGRAAFGLRVQALVRQRELTVHAMPGGMPPNAQVVGASIASDGSALVVLNPDGLLAAPAAQGRTRADPVAVAPKHVLVVDDALTVRELQRAVLERAGYAVSTATDGQRALEHLRANHVDLVITDVEMPRMDGFALTEAIRQSPDFAATPVIILTTLGGADHRDRGLEAGADSYLLKADFNAESLLSAVDDQIGRP